ncbi:sensor histidine kinase [Pontibacillus salicampi]|uniref:histidine kinase n=1 Tax=Pontibacillus salicampi TaxID=1449801 RepID=A0ABV6LRV8_9BACI
MTDLQKRRIVVSTITVVVLVLGFFLAYTTMNKSFTGINAEKQEDVWVITNIDEMGWAWHQNIEVGDHILSINGKRPGVHKPMKRYGVIGSLDELVLQRNGIEVTYEPEKKFYSKTIVYHNILPFVVFLILFSFSIILYRKKKEDKAAVLLIAFLLAVGFGYLSAAASARTEMLARIINGISLLMIPVLLMHYYHAYFSKYNILLFPKKLLALLYSLNMVVVLMDTVYIYLPVSGFYAIIRHTQLAVFSMEVLGCLSILLYYYFRYKGTVHKPVFQNTIFAIIVSFVPFILFTAIPSTLLGINILPASVTASCLIFLPIFFLYQVLTNSLFDVDFINSRLRYYSFISFILTSIIIGMLVIMTSFTILQWIRISIILYIAIIAFFYMEERLNLRRRLFGENFNFQISLDQFSNDISKMLKREELDDRLIQEVRTVLPVNGVALLECQKGHSRVHMIKGDQMYPEHSLSKLCSEYGAFMRPRKSFQLDKGRCYVISEMRNSLHILWVDQKMNHTPFNKDERRWLKTLVHYTSIVYENFQLMENVTEELKESMYNNAETPSWMTRLLFNLSEKERARLASDLHDEALQEQLVWYRRVEGLLEKDTLPEDVHGDLAEVKEGLLDVVTQIRETCTFLRPPFLKESGIVEALSYLIDHYRLRCDFLIELDATQFHLELDHEHALTLYRIVQELLNNATKHSKATRIEFDLKNEGDMVILNYKDDGIGVPESEWSKKHTDSMGLAGIRQRVKSLEGDVEFYSPEEGGFEIAVVLQESTQKNFFQVM